MHEYSIDKSARNKTIIYIFIISTLISAFICRLLNGFFDNLYLQLEKDSAFKSVLELLELWEFPNLIGVAVIYGILSFVHEHWLWKIFRKLYGLPNLNGHWSGTLSSSYRQDPIRMEMDITQTWSRISFKSTFPDTNSNSYSNNAAIHIDDNKGISIYFGFQNQSNDIDSKLITYYGYNILNLEKKGTHIKAIYFNNRPNSKKGQGGNMGSFELDRKSKKAEK